MATGYYLLDNPPRRTQFYKTRRSKPSGTIVVHTAENLADVNPPDTGAEAVASFIRDRSDAGSYHRLCDQDSIVKLVPLSYVAFHDGTISNQWSIGISGALRAEQWKKLTKEQKNAYIFSMAAAAQEANQWMQKEYGITIPARLLTKQEVADKKPGFVSHANMETWFGTPGRRSDPGVDFDWNLFFYFYTGKAKTLEEAMLQEIIAYHEGYFNIKVGTSDWTMDVRKSVNWHLWRINTGQVTLEQVRIEFQNTPGTVTPK